MTIHNTSVSNPAAYTTTAQSLGITSTTRTSSPKTDLDARSGGDNAGWKSLIRTHRNATNGYSIRRTSHIHDNTTTKGVYLQYGGSPPRWRLGTYTVSGAVLGTLLGQTAAVSASLKAQCEVAARAKFLSNLRSERSPFQGGVFLGELKETLGMIKNPFSALQKGLASYYNRIRHLDGRLKHAKNLAKVIPEVYLEYAYGWKPLLGDIQSAADAYMKLVLKPELQIVKGINVLDGSGTTSHGEIIPAGASGHAGKILYVSKNTVRFVSRVKGCRMDRMTNFPSAQRLADLSGFNLEGFIPTIWELIPYSFLIDYFTNASSVCLGWFTGTSDLAWFYQGTEAVSEVEIGGRVVMGNAGSVYDKHVVTTGSVGSARKRVLEYNRFIPDFSWYNNLSISFRSPGETQWWNVAMLGLSKMKTLY